MEESILLLCFVLGVKRKKVGFIQKIVADWDQKTVAECDLTTVER
jgi:hypothetical protein